MIKDKRYNDGTKNEMLENYVSEDGTYLIPVGWEVYSTIRVKANNLADALRIARDQIDDIPCDVAQSEYVDGSYKIDAENLIDAQDYADCSDIVIGEEAVFEQEIEEPEM
jgi:hypothetical protein